MVFPLRVTRSVVCRAKGYFDMSAHGCGIRIVAGIAARIENYA